MKAFLLLLTLLLLTSCAFTAPGSETSYVDTVSFQTISATEAREIMESESTFVILDVRSEAEFLSRHIEGAMLMPVDEIATRAEAELINKDTVLLVYCQSGRRSANAAAILANMGFTHVHDFGGINDWSYETVTP